ncbi:MAG TPA: alpha-ketoglutarate-dependent dioxygenase AlkB [Bacteroidales bacterium]|jgi:alkylated DNA repair dioxygenase AlkB|nr:alpha-ketoglutarate-dependent dioxygenase AlkB [Bacteroidales bacterium]
MDLFTELEEYRERKFDVFNLRDESALWYMKHFLREKEANEYFNSLLKNTDWKQEYITIYNRTVPYNRLLSWHGDQGYSLSYAGDHMSLKPWTKELLQLKQDIEYFLPGHKFNSVLLSLYRNGNDRVSWHADHEKDWAVNPIIASLSLGATRRFDIKHKTVPGLEQKFELINGTLVIMMGAFQHHWLHQVPKQKKITEPRINLTFRKMQMM